MIAADAAIDALGVGRLCQCAMTALQASADPKLRTYLILLHLRHELQVE